MTNTRLFIFFGILCALLSGILVFLFFQHNEQIVLKETKYVVYEQNIYDVIEDSKYSLVSILDAKDITIGSGAIVSADGFIATFLSKIPKNIHDYKVRLHNGELFTIQSIYTDPQSLLSLIKIDPLKKALQPLQVVENNNLQTGQRVALIETLDKAIDPSIQIEIIKHNGKYKEYSGNSEFWNTHFPYAQIDNSNKNHLLGTPVLGLEGVIIGVLAQKNDIYYIAPLFYLDALFRSLELFQDIRFVPVDFAYELILPASEAFKNIPIQEGVKVGSLNENSIFSNILKEGDIILEIGDFSINLNNSIIDVMHHFLPEDSVQLKIFRYNTQALDNVDEKTFNQIVKDNTLIFEVSLSE